jgi:DNA repair protein RecO (recombination protein O)
MQAVVISRRDFRENDQIICFYSRDYGRLDLLAKGIKKITSKLSGNLTPGNLVEIEVAKGKEIDHLIKVNSVSIFKNSKYFSKQYVLNLIDKLVKNQEKDERIFSLLVSYLNFSNQPQVGSKSVVMAFLVKLLVYLGYSPQLDQCSECEIKEIRMKLDLRRGLICHNCYDKLLDKRNIVYISKIDIKNFGCLIADDWHTISNLDLSTNLVKLIYSYTKFHNEKKINKYILLNI